MSFLVSEPRELLGHLLLSVLIDFIVLLLILLTLLKLFAPLFSHVFPHVALLTDIVLEFGPVVWNLLAHPLEVGVQTGVTTVALGVR